MPGETKERLLPVGPWLPDSIERDNEALSVAKNVLPLFGSYRLIPEMATFSESPSDAGDSYPLTGGTSHLLDLTQALFTLRPASDITVPDEYVQEEGEILELFDSINSGDPDLGEFIYSRSVTAADFYVTKLAVPPFVPPNDNNHVLRFQYQSVDPHNKGWTVEVELRQGGVVVDPGADPVRKTITGTGTANLAFDEIDLSASQAGAITDYSDLELAFRGTLDSAAGTRELFPVADIANEGYVADPPPAEGTTIFQNLDDFADDTELLRRNLPGNFNRKFNVRMDQGFTPITPVDHKLRFRARLSNLPDSGDPVDCPVQMYLINPVDGNESARTPSTELTQAFVTYETLLTVPQVKAAGDLYSGYNMLFRFHAINDPNGKNGEVELSALSFSYPDAEGVVLTWAEFQIPDVDSQTESDSVRRYVGDQVRLYEIIAGEAEWRDVSRAALYAQSGERPQSWHMTSFGQDVVATNFIDPVQIKGVGDTLFQDMIVTPDEPRGKYAITIQNHLVLANINPLSVTSNPIIKGQPDMFWWSGRENASQFFIADLTTQSGLNRLLETPGAINGAVGGEWGTLFKRTSIFRINYIGPPFIFGKDMLSRRVGTHYPRSIVPEGQDVYFIDFGGIYRITNGEGLELIGDQQVLRYLFDSQYQTEAIDQETTAFGLERDSTVVGSYIPVIDCIWWMYRRKDDLFNACTRVLVYSIRENRFTTLELPDLGVEGGAGGGGIGVGVQEVVTQSEFDHIMSEENVQSSIESMIRAMLIYTWDRENASTIKHACWTFSSLATYDAKLTSHILSSNYISQGGRRNIQINAVRPIFSLTKEIATPPNTNVTIETSEHPFISVNPVEAIAVGTAQTTDGWMPLNKPLNGGFFKWSIDIPRQTDNDLREFIGLEVQYVDGGLGG